MADEALQLLREMNAKIEQISAALVAAGLTLGPLKVVSRNPAIAPRIRTERDVQFMTRERRQAIQLEEQATRQTSSGVRPPSAAVPATTTAPPSSASPGASTASGTPDPAERP